MVAALSALLAALVTAAFTSLLHRRRERVSWEEAAQGKLADLRYDALVAILKAIGRFYWWKLEVIEPLDPDDENAMKTAAARLDDAASKMLRVFEARMFLLPHEVRVIIPGYLDEMADAKDGDAVRLTAVMLGDELERFLPRLQRRKLARAERMGPALRERAEEEVQAQRSLHGPEQQSSADPSSPTSD